MTKNIVIGVLVFLLVTETGFLLVKRQSYHRQIVALTSQKPQNSFPPAGSNAKGGKQMVLAKGTNLKTSPLFAYAYEIAPTMAAAAKSHLTGFTITSKTQADGSIVVNLTPKNSVDQSQHYTVQKGQILYYIEQTLFDDKTDSDTDLNYRDDYGIITDTNGIIQ